VEHHPDACRRCGTLLQGEDPAPLRHQVIEIPPITPLVIEHRLHRLVCPCCSTSTCATLPADVEISCGTIATIRQRLSAALAQPMAEALQAASQQPVAYVVDEVLRAAVETGAPMGNADGGNPDGKRGWQWV
jgi:hypothetical protein